MIITGLMLTLNSCGDLTQTPYSSVTPNSFYKSNEQLSSAVGAAYSHLHIYGGPNFVRPVEATTDEFVIPQRGSDWGANGMWIRLHKHQETPKNQFVNRLWNFLFGGVSTCNRLIAQLNQAMQNETITKDTGDSYISELKALRAFYYFWLLDRYGNVPIITGFAEVSNAPPNNNDFQTGRTKLLNFELKQIHDNIDNLSNAVDQSTYGRMTTWGAHFLLAKLYLNAGVYTGTHKFSKADMDSVVANCDAIINSGKFHMAANYFDNFKVTNSNSPEFIFAIPYDEQHLGGFGLPRSSFHQLNQETYNLKVQPSNGYAMPKNFYYSFQSNDIRKKGLLHGYQYDANGNHLIDQAAFVGEPHGDTLYFTAYINELQPKAWREAGVRFNKWMVENGADPNNLNNDFAIFRYTDVLLMKAEALWRMNNGSSKALNLVNKVRERAGLGDYSTLDAYKLLLERGHEFYAEYWRDQDLIRFRGGLHFKYDSLGTRGSRYAPGPTAFNDAWWEKKVDSDTHVNVLPIPFTQLESNRNLHQNPGY